MTTARVSAATGAGRQASRVMCWIEFLILGLGLPATIWIVSKIITLSIPAALHGSPGQRFLLWITGPSIAEWLFVIGVALVLRRRGLSFRNLGVWRIGNWLAWLIALSFGALSIAGNMRFLPRMHVPLSYAFFPPPGFHLAAALIMGITAGFCEEVLFRAFLMSEFAASGYSKAMQVLIPGAAFGLSHAGYLNQGFFPWLGIALPTAILGMIWGVSYLAGRRSLVPAIVAHFLNDATALPWISFFMVTGQLGAPHP
ncbi:MAG TPA: CPBP family intramembrane glutamic endopeptidase [Gemmatimonadaceae bacterium]